MSHLFLYSSALSTPIDTQKCLWNEYISYLMMHILRSYSLFTVYVHE